MSQSEIDMLDRAEGSKSNWNNGCCINNENPEIQNWGSCKRIILQIWLSTLGVLVAVFSLVAVVLECISGGIKKILTPDCIQYFELGVNGIFALVAGLTEKACPVWTFIIITASSCTYLSCPFFSDQ